MKIRLLQLIIPLLFILGSVPVYATNYTWTGSTTGNWQLASNWGGAGYPGSVFSVADNATINTNNVVITFTNTALLGSIKSITINPGIKATISVNSGVTMTLNNSGGTVITIGTGMGASTLVFTGAGNVSTTGDITTAQTAAFTISNNQTTFSSGTYTALNNTTTTVSSGTTLIMNSITCTWNSVTPIFTNAGPVTLNNCTVTMNGGNGAINNTSTFTFNNSTITVGGNPGAINNNSPGQFYLEGSTINLSTNAVTCNNASGATFTAEAGSTINLNSYGSQLKNAGTMNIGTSNSACTLNIPGQPINNTTGSNVYNTGSFYLGSTSTIVFTSGVYQQTVYNAGTTFTLKSDAYGTGQIGSLDLSNAQSVKGIITVQRYFTGGSLSNRGYRLMSSPVNNTNNTTPTPSSNTYNFTTSPSLHDAIIITGPGGNTNGFDPPSAWGVPVSSTSVTILNYSNATSLFSSPTSLSAATPKVGNGFYFFFRGDNISNRATKLVKSGTYATPEAVVAGQTGYINQGNITVNLSYTGSNGFNLVGNPYPATINLTGGGITPSSTSVAYDAWMYDRSTNSCQPYDYSAGSSPDPNITQYLASGEGFFVKVTAASQTITFTEAAKDLTASHQQTGSKLIMGIPKQFADGRIRLKLQQDSVNADFAMLAFNDSYNTNYDESEDVDDINAAGQTVTFSSLTADNIPVAINRLPMDKQKTSSFLAVGASTSGTYVLSAIDILNISTAYNVWLVDHFTNDSVNLRTTPTYSFNIDLSNAATFGNSRFEIALCKQVLPPYQLISFTGQRTNNTNVLTWTTLNEYDYTTFAIQSSVDGKTFTSIGTIQSDSSGKYTYTDKYATAGTFYQLKQSDINDVITYSNIIFIDNTSNIFSLYPNPATNTIQFKLNQDVHSSLSLRVFNSLGTQVKSSTFTQNSGTQDVSLLTPGIYTILLFDNSARQTVASGKFIKI